MEIYFVISDGVIFWHGMIFARRIFNMHTRDVGYVHMRFPQVKRMQVTCNVDIRVHDLHLCAFTW